MNRGSLSIQVQAEGGYDSASMRPRFMNRGSDSGSQGTRRRDQGFNEAPIHESGKSVRMRPVQHARPRFNEAPIHESGKWGAAMPNIVLNNLLQ